NNPPWIVSYDCIGVSTGCLKPDGTAGEGTSNHKDNNGDPLYKNPDTGALEPAPTPDEDGNCGDGWTKKSVLEIKYINGSSQTGVKNSCIPLTGDDPNSDNLDPFPNVPQQHKDALIDALDNGQTFAD